MEIENNIHLPFARRTVVVGRPLPSWAQGGVAPGGRKRKAGGFAPRTINTRNFGEFDFWPVRDLTLWVRGFSQDRPSGPERRQLGYRMSLDIFLLAGLRCTSGNVGPRLLAHRADQQQPRLQTLQGS
jgi:hypothetical protein